jgi:hypothetical protein
MHIYLYSVGFVFLCVRVIQCGGEKRNKNQNKQRALELIESPHSILYERQTEDTRRARLR